MKIIEYIKRLFKKLDLEPTVTISADQIKSMFPRLKNGFHAGDVAYNSTTIESMKDFLSIWAIKHKKWTGKFDCDNFSDAFMGWAKLTNPSQGIGTIWVKQSRTAAHAINFFILWDGKQLDWAYIEPQTGEIFKVTDKKVINWKPYYVRI